MTITIFRDFFSSKPRKMVQFLNVLFQEIDELKKSESSCVTSVQFVPRCT